MDSMRSASVTVVLALLLVAAFATLASMTPAAEAAVNSGIMVRFINFPRDFTSAKEHPFTGEDYLPGGNGTLNIVFVSLSGKGLVNITASSEAFTNKSEETKAVPAVLEPVSVRLRYTVKSGIDGSFPVTVTVFNEQGTVLDLDFPEVKVWSKEHIQAADTLLTVENVLSNQMGDVKSGDARRLFANATEQHALARRLYFAGDWSEAAKKGGDALDLARKAQEAEASLLSRTATMDEKRLQIEEKASSLEETRLATEQRLADLQEQRFQVERNEKIAATIAWSLASVALAMAIAVGAYAFVRLTRQK